ncbi:MAG: DUF4430 domain-containing protein [Cellulosilyticum sp.]|nr:DUF4430 domain-containing protein [Cellulosilyticum sp.]
MRLKNKKIIVGCLLVTCLVGCNRQVEKQQENGSSTVATAENNQVAQSELGNEEVSDDTMATQEKVSESTFKKEAEQIDLQDQTASLVESQTPSGLVDSKKESVEAKNIEGKVAQSEAIQDKVVQDSLTQAKVNAEEVKNKDTVVKDTKEQQTVTLSVSCSTILNNKESLNPDKVELIPDKGIILSAEELTYTEGETVFDVLVRATKNHKIHMEYTGSDVYKTNYIEGINNLYEFDCGPLSGWMYRVNGVFPNYGCSNYVLEKGDVIEWVYTCDLGKDVGAGEVLQESDK